MSKDRLDEPIVVYTSYTRVKGKVVVVRRTGISTREAVEIGAWITSNAHDLCSEPMMLRCKCGEKCRWWTCEILTVGREIEIPGCRMREFLKRFRKFLCSRYRDTSWD